MPDVNRKTISSTQASALIGESPWETEFTLSEWFRGKEIEVGDNRMTWGLKMQPLVLEQCAEDLRLEVTPNDDDVYVTRGIFGATRDAIITCPDRGLGALETKCVFDYRRWMERWAGGDRPPVDYEVQLQLQMFVGDGVEPYNWGVIAAWLAGEMHYFERKPDLELWHMLEELGIAFLKKIEDGAEFEPFGVDIEYPWIMQKWPVVERKTLDLTEANEANIAMAETARMYEWCKGQKSEFTKLEKDLKTKMVGLAEDNDTIAFPADIYVNVKKSKPSKEKVCTEEMVGTVLRKSSVSTTVKVTAPEKPVVAVDEGAPIDA